MPIRDDLLAPIPGPDPAGPDLIYDPVFDQIQDARREDDETLPTGDWKRAPKKADYLQVIKLAGEALAKRSKDLRLAGPLIEAHLKREGTHVLAPSLRLLRELQETFWPTIHPKMEEGDLELRSIAVERVVRLIVPVLDEAAVTRSGLSAAHYKVARKVGYEKDADSDERLRVRQRAIDEGKITAEEFDKQFAATPKSFYIGGLATVGEVEEQLRLLDEFQRQAYGNSYPNLTPLESAVQDLRRTVAGLLEERLKTDPNPVEASSETAAAPVETVPEASGGAVAGLGAGLVARVMEAFSGKPVKDTAGGQLAQDTPGAPPAQMPAPAAPSQPADAYGLVVRSAQFLAEHDAGSPVPYLICAALRMGETRMQGAGTERGFAQAPSSEVRSKLQSLARAGEWSELLRAALPVLGEPCGRVWLDIHRYIFRAAQETGASAIAAAVVGSVRGLLAERPEVRGWMLEDDTPAANPDTQAWLDADVVVKEQPAAVETRMKQPVALPPLPVADGATGEDPHETAMKLLRAGRAGEAIGVLAREAELEQSGRSRFVRRLQLAEMCLTAGHGQVARAVLEDLAKEIDRRQLETWEGSDVVAAPIALLLRCLEGTPDVNGVREALFARLCLIDPIAALAAGSSH